jgi:hypothetical protein
MCDSTTTRCIQRERDELEQTLLRTREGLAVAEVKALAADRATKLTEKVSTDMGTGQVKRLPPCEAS